MTALQDAPGLAVVVIVGSAGAAEFHGLDAFWPWWRDATAAKRA